MSTVSATKTAAVSGSVWPKLNTTSQSSSPSQSQITRLSAATSAAMRGSRGRRRRLSAAWSAKPHNACQAG